MNRVNEPDENDKISNLLYPDAVKQNFDENRKTGQTFGTNKTFYSNLIYWNNFRLIF
ncbi:hypothetical protein HanXRQr2_Chr07g0312121 [Helianthus annuus]|uniref:Uncharacterized protein n=1 Tax=Helianthus annuus TaxID=4232 RepID=A0A251UD72_HELAN|nr:hypothetical protein HanXRQr2_Chr07g0312121 [Helianthus annuus]